ncbi:hypothetical protein QP166_07535 [Sphingomonas sp. LR60]|uniref:hypothetical protein n=1 Tax=Sphingomonas sp. LR60 TaxID=3050233 RepID=UPI002FDF9176
MKTRKWLYLSSATLSIVHGGLYNEKAASSLLKFVKAPTSVVEPALAIGVAYLLLQYSLLVGQLLSTYDIVISDRFIFRRSDDLTSARDRIKEATSQLQSSINAFRQDFAVALQARQNELVNQIALEGKKLNALTEQRVKLQQQLSGNGSLAKVMHDEGRQNAIRARLINSLKKLKSSPLEELDPSYDPNVKLCQSALLEAEQAFKILRSEMPSERHGYRFAEVIIDTLRLGPPWLFAALALLHYLVIWPFNG